MRLDKYLAHMGYGTRKEVKALIKKGQVSIEGNTITRPEYKVDEETEVVVDGLPLNYVSYEYYLLNKPAGTLSATHDASLPTVMDLVFPIRNDCAPVGRLDLDTEGVLLITNDGQLAHKLLSPKHHIPKTYYVEVSSPLPADAETQFLQPMVFEDFTSSPAQYEPIDATHAYLTIHEGKYHQVKRMFERIGCPVLYLNRTKFAFLDCTDIPLGEYRSLSQDEIDQLYQITQSE